MSGLWFCVCFYSPCAFLSPIHCHLVQVCLVVSLVIVCVFKVLSIQLFFFLKRHPCVLCLHRSRCNPLDIKDSICEFSVSPRSVLPCS